MPEIEVGDGRSQVLNPLSYRPWPGGIRTRRLLIRSIRCLRTGHSTRVPPEKEVAAA
ncbi:hypothetical protein [Streptomyces sp. NBC_00503]|uniref:hypothetical protein n=1 Tax=Streptomyces sp. NBC_00503 TaxID=2903659 RepID=UPI002E81505D|nr:hypothetical protein [Streptomyces sp. NBC_00503]WUD83881.1 hypothetical protein OG490_26880 [Streptomyces sp. NBC_00503]